MKSKHPRESAVVDHVYKIFPNDLNDKGTIFGGTVMSILDRVAVVVAQRHSNKICVTASVDAIHFINPSYKGNILIVQASVNRSWNTSMEVGTKITTEDPILRTKSHVVSAYFTFVGLDKNSKPSSVPLLVPENKEEERRFEEADIRRKKRIAWAKDIKEFRKKFI